MIWTTIVFSYLLLLWLNGVLSQQPEEEKQKTPEQELGKAIAKYLSETQRNSKE